MRRLALDFNRQRKEGPRNGELLFNFLDGNAVVNKSQESRRLARLHELPCDLFFAVLIICCPVSQ